MTQHTRPDDFAAMLGFSIAVVTGETPAATDPSKWIKVTPRGPVQTRDGRRYSFDPEKLVDRFKTDGVDLPADTNHAIALQGMAGQKAPAIGWASDLQARPDGTYAKMDWLPEGEATLKARTHRYVSPSFRHDASGDATWLHSISLVGAPALAMPAIASSLSEGGSVLSTLSAVAVALGVEDAADQAALLAAIAAFRADAVPKSQHDGALSALSDATARLATLAAETRSNDVTALIEGALKAKKILPVQRQQYLALCSTDAGLDAVRSLFGNMPSLLVASGLDGQRTPGADRSEENPHEIAARARAYREEQRRLGRSITTAEAVNHVSKTPA